MDIDILEKNFGSNSANNKKYKELWIKSASIFISQINSIIKYEPTIINIYDFYNDKSEELKNIFDKYGTDKGTYHNYYIIYYYIIEKLGRNSKLNLFEIGLGTNDINLVSTMGINGIPGASLRSFKEFLPNSNIYGADIDKNILFHEDRINSKYIDQLDINTYNTFNDKSYDIIIDDGLHSIGANLNTLIFALNNLNKNGWLIIEDINVSFLDNWKIIDYILKNNSEYKTYIIKASIHYMYVIEKIN